MKSSITNQPSLPVWKRKTAWLALIPAVVILCLAVMPQAQSSQANINMMMCKWAYLQGSWLVTVTLGIPDGPPPFETLQTYTSSGEVIGSQPSTPGWLWTPWQGTWTRKGPRQFVFTAIAFCNDSTVEPAALWKIILRETVVIEPDGNTYNSTSSTQEWFGPDGYHEGPIERGDMTHGVRIKAE
jgi:hypothetical protein